MDFFMTIIEAVAPRSVENGTPVENDTPTNTNNCVVL